MKVEKKLQIAKKRLKDKKTDKEIIWGYNQKILKNYYKNNWVKLENEIQEVNKCYRRNEAVINENNFNTRRCELCKLKFIEHLMLNILKVET